MQWVRSRWHWLLPLVPAVLITEGTAYLVAMIHHGGVSFTNAVQDILHSRAQDFKDGEILRWIWGHPFHLGFRSVPFAIVSIFCAVAAIKIEKRWLLPPIMGAWIGILSFTFPAMVVVWRPLFTDERASSTAVLEFLYIPFYAIPNALLGITFGLCASFLMATLCRQRFLRIAKPQPNAIDQS